MLKENERLESLNIKDYKILQNSTLYCFTSDSVILSKFAKAKKGDIVADICSGSGIVSPVIFEELCAKHYKKRNVIWVARRTCRNEPKKYRVKQLAKQV